MSLFTLHSDIAKELFIGFVLDRPHDSCKALAKEAIEIADTFTEEYQLHQRAAQSQQQESALNSMSASIVPTDKLMGCRKCFGSGGKRDDPCATCNGTGKVRKG